MPKKAPKEETATAEPLANETPATAPAMPVPRDNTEYLNQVIDECHDVSTKARLLALRHNVKNDDNIHFLIKEVARHEARAEEYKNAAKRAKEDAKQCLDELQTTLADMRDGASLFTWHKKEEDFLLAKEVLAIEQPVSYAVLFAETETYQVAIEGIVEVEPLNTALEFYRAHKDLGHIEDLRISRIKDLRKKFVEETEEEPADVIEAPAATDETPAIIAGIVDDVLSGIDSRRGDDELFEVRILIPNAGDGMLASALATALTAKSLAHEMLLLEPNPALAQQCLDATGRAPLQVNFLETRCAGFSPTVIVMQLEEEQIDSHVLHAWDLLEPGGLLSAVVPNIMEDDLPIEVIKIHRHEECVYSGLADMDDVTSCRLLFMDKAADEAASAPVASSNGNGNGKKAKAKKEAAVVDLHEEEEAEAAAH
jgi:hypothetical protein